MARIQVSKKFSLEHLGDEWKGCYLQFHSFTIGDIEKNQNSIFSKGGATKPEDATSEETMARLKTIVTLLQDKFIAGRVYDSEKKEVTDMKAEELEQFPLEVLSEAISFLSPKTEKNS